MSEEPKSHLRTFVYFFKSSNYTQLQIQTEYKDILKLLFSFCDIKKSQSIA
jgi:hypothetical protein